MNAEVMKPLAVLVDTLCILFMIVICGAAYYMCTQERDNFSASQFNERGFLQSESGPLVHKLICVLAKLTSVMEASFWFGSFRKKHNIVPVPNI